jgi:hypothetical protein
MTATAERSRGNPKSQAPNPKEVSNSNNQRGARVQSVLGFVIWFLGFVGNLGLGSWDFQLRWPFGSWDFQRRWLGIAS